MFSSLLHPCAESEAFSIWKKYLFDALSSSKVIRILSTFVTMFGIISVANYVVIFFRFYRHLFWRFCGCGWSFAMNLNIIKSARSLTFSKFTSCFITSRKFFYKPKFKELHSINYNVTMCELSAADSKSNFIKSQI